MNGKPAANSARHNSMLGLGGIVPAMAERRRSVRGVARAINSPQGKQRPVAEARRQQALGQPDLLPTDQPVLG
jgi:hypothetical protein